MHLYENKLYLNEIRFLLSKISNKEAIKGKTYLISGTTGMIGSLMTDVLLYGNIWEDFNCKIIALVRNQEKARARFEGFGENNGLLIRSADISEHLNNIDFKGLNIDYIIHAASNTHPIAYATDPVNTVLSNILGANNLLQLAVEQKVQRFLFLSSVEIYGENRGDTERFDESYCGYIDCNTLRATYPEGKRAAESLCHAYHKQYGVDFVIARLARAYGPTLQRSDTKALSQFLWNGLAGDPIVLKSAGTQKYSYIYAGDAVLGLLWLLTNGVCGNAYNLTGMDSDVTLKDLARMIANYTKTEVHFELPDAVEAAGYSKATKAMLDSHKITENGFQTTTSLREGIARTLDILRMM